ncbi:AmmeMemoRadiSam system protein B [Candidatus Woesearchaeota archaeon]|nr:AmmeMemoRadiSam system protein B [Candidatus Woesearchaeota archaeon]
MIGGIWQKMRGRPVLIAIPLIILMTVIVSAWLLRGVTPHGYDVIKPPSPGYVREAQVAGQFYPLFKIDLELAVDNLLAKAKTTPVPEGRELKALVVPHAGYIYSGQVAADGFALVPPSTHRVYLIGSNHNSEARFSGISVGNYTHFRTPLGLVPVDTLATGRLRALSSAQFVADDAPHDSHILEVELPFLQRRLPEFTIVPMVTGWIAQEEIPHYAAALENVMRRDPGLLVVSSDLSHYHPYDEAVVLDTACVSAIAAVDYSAATSCEACGYHAILMLLDIAVRSDWTATLIEYANSGDAAGSKDSVVGYSAIAFFGPASAVSDPYPSSEKSWMLALARRAVEGWVRTGTKVTVDASEVPARLKETRGCFVTLNEGGALRGCIGHIIAQEELYKCIIDNAINAASNDARFEPVAASELDDIAIDISILTHPEELAFGSPEELLGKLVPLRDGVVLERGWRTSTYLPQVWEQLPGKEEFLTQLCKKQGSEGDCWRDPGTKVYVYRTIVFGEE